MPSYIRESKKLRKLEMQMSHEWGHIVHPTNHPFLMRLDLKCMEKHLVSNLVNLKYLKLKIEGIIQLHEEYNALREQLKRVKSK